MSRAARAAFVAFALLSGCGYRPLRSGLAGHPQIRVLASEASAPAGAGADVAEELASGARVELARHGALGGSDARDRLRLALVRLDDLAEGIEVVHDGPPAEGRTRARGVRLRAIARGVIEGGGEPWETADVEAVEVVAAGPDPLAWDAARKAAARSVARKVGALVAREVLGVP